MMKSEISFFKKTAEYRKSYIIGASGALLLFHMCLGTVLLSKFDWIMESIVWLSDENQFVFIYFSALVVAPIITIPLLLVVLLHFVLEKNNKCSRSCTENTSSMMSPDEKIYGTSRDRTGTKAKSARDSTS